MKFEDLTENQQAVYKCFHLSGHLFDDLNIDNFECCNTPYDIEEWHYHTGLSTKTIRAVVTTLVNAGLIEIGIESRDLKWIFFTKEGFMLLEATLPPEYHKCFVSKKQLAKIGRG